MSGREQQKRQPKRTLLSMCRNNSTNGTRKKNPVTIFFLFDFLSFARIFPLLRGPIVRMLTLFFLEIFLSLCVCVGRVVLDENMLITSNCVTKWPNDGHTITHPICSKHIWSRQFRFYTKMRSDTFAL